MANFFLDNDDIRFLFDFMDLAELARLQEASTPRADAAADDFGPEDDADAVDNYRRILEILGEVAAENIAPNAEQVDREGNHLNADGTVTLHALVQENLKWLAQADMMGFILPRKYGGLNCPIALYTMAIEILSRADASLMNLFGLQGIGETICAFASDEIKDELLPRFASGEMTGAMVLTEPDAGSDLQAVRLRADQGEDGNWRLNGVKRFITNGCGDILLTLARSEADLPDGRGLSLFVSERSAHIKVRHLEHKLGIHGSPTCELVYEDAPARLIGERQRGLITYVMALMNGARVGIAAQSLGIAEAAYRMARTYAHARQQFGAPIERLPAVAEMLTDMQIDIEAARALTYETSRICDLENCNQRLVEYGAISADEKSHRKKSLRALKRRNSMLTPMAKYCASEMAVRVANTALQVLGGSGYMQDYPAERHLRDARITNIYEGTSQLQIVAASRGVSSGVFESYVAEFEQKPGDDPVLSPLKEKLADGRRRVVEAVAYVKQQSPAYLDLSGQRLVDAALVVIVGHLLVEQAAASARKKQVARRFIEHRLPWLGAWCEQIGSGDKSAIDEFELLAGPVPKRTG